MANQITLKIGDIVWFFDDNRRVYKTDEKGRSVGAPIWREHWVKHRLVGENRASFFFLRGDDPDHEFQADNVKVYHRLAKSDLKLGKPISWVAFSEKDINRKTWVKDNGYKLSQVVSRSGDFDALSEVARLLAPDLVPPEDL